MPSPFEGLTHVVARLAKADGTIVDDPTPVGGSGGAGGTVALDAATLAALESTTVTVSNPTANPETGLAKDATLTAVRDRLPAALDADGGAKVHVQNPVTTVSVSNFPGTQPVSGSVTVGNIVDITPASPAAGDYLPVRLTDGAAFYTAGGGSGGTVNQGTPGTSPWLTRPVGLPTFYALADNVAFAANKHHISIFNAAGSGKVVKVKKVFATNLQITAVTGAVVRFDIKRTTAQSAGTAITPVTMDSTNAALSGVTVATGATITEGALLFPWITVSEEQPATSALSINLFQQATNLILEGNEVQEPVLRPGEGLTIKQITSTAVGSHAWLIAFTVE